MLSSLFALRGTLPRTTYIAIELVGMLLLLLIWQIVASLSSSSTQSFGLSSLQPSYNSKGNTATIEQPIVLVYNLTADSTAQGLAYIGKQAADQKRTLVIVSSGATTAWAQAAARHAPAGLVVLQANNNSTLQQVAQTTGSSIVDTDFIAGDSNLQISTQFAGTADQISLSAQAVQFVTQHDFISNALLPSPIEVVQSLGELISTDHLLANLAYSLYLNLAGYLLALLIAVPLGFLIGLFPLFRALFSRNIDALRFVPLTAVTGLFIAWFGLGSSMKIAFLAFGILVYLLPVVVQRIIEVDEVYVQTAYTLGATKWQQIWSVFTPAVLSRVSDDVRVLVAISWTYIIVTEVVNANSGGIGALAFKMARQSQIDKVFAILLVIMVVGFLQDLLFKLLDRILFAYKYQ